MSEISQPTVVAIPGDGIGPEILEVTQRVVDRAVATKMGQDFKICWQPAEAGLECLESTGKLLPEETLTLVREHRVALKGPTATPIGGGHRSVNVALRQELALYASVRPYRWFPGVPSPVHYPERAKFVIFRENTEDVYAGVEFEAGSDQVRQIVDLLGLNSKISYDSAIGLKPISEQASKRLVRAAAEHVLKRNLPRLTLVHKGNIMKFTEGAFCRWGYEAAKEVLGERFLSEKDLWEKHGGKQPDGAVVVLDRIADAMFQEILLKPLHHRVIATTNLNGDYLSDAAAAVVGGLGMAPGANYGDGIALFEATHGTAPDIAGKNLANPCGLILSSVMMLEYFGWQAPADAIVDVIEKAIQAGQVTGDLVADGAEPITCSQFGDYLVAKLR